MPLDANDLRRRGRYEGMAVPPMAPEDSYWVVIDSLSDYFFWDST
jgi:hypothetical protein